MSKAPTTKASLAELLTLASCSKELPEEDLRMAELSIHSPD